MQRQSIITVLAAVSLTILSLSGLEAGPRKVQPAKGSVVLVRDLTVEPEVFEQTVAYVRENSPMTVRAVVAESTLAMMTSQGQLKTLERLAATDEEKPSIAVALVREAADVKERVLLVREQNAGVVNLTVLQPEIRKTKNEEEQFVRLIEKETLRTMGYLLGLGQCFNPRCCMSGYRLDPGQEVAGRNYCPGCRMKLETTLGVSTSATTPQ